MLYESFIPSKEADLLLWSNNFSTLINADAVAYGLTLTQASDYAALNTAYAAALQAANDNGTRTPSAIVTKNNAKAALIAFARELAGIVRENPNVTDTQKSNLGLNVPNPEPSPVPVPEYPPVMYVERTFGRTVRIRLRDMENTDRRGKPDGVIGATVLYYVGATVPDDVTAWSFYCNDGRTIVDVTIPTSVPEGSKVWITAFWFNTRKESGPAASPIYTNVVGGLVQAA